MDDSIVSNGPTSSVVKSAQQMEDEAREESSKAQHAIASSNNGFLASANSPLSVIEPSLQSSGDTNDVAGVSAAQLQQMHHELQVNSFTRRLELATQRRKGNALVDRLSQMFPAQYDRPEEAVADVPADEESQNLANEVFNYSGNNIDHRKLPMVEYTNVEEDDFWTYPVEKIADFSTGSYYAIPDENGKWSVVPGWARNSENGIVEELSIEDADKQYQKSHARFGEFDNEEDANKAIEKLSALHKAMYEGKRKQYLFENWDEVSERSKSDDLKREHLEWMLSGSPSFVHQEEKPTVSQATKGERGILDSLQAEMQADTGEKVSYGEALLNYLLPFASKVNKARSQQEDDDLIKTIRAVEYGYIDPSKLARLEQDGFTLQNAEDKLLQKIKNRHEANDYLSSNELPWYKKPIHGGLQNAGYTLEYVLGSAAMGTGIGGLALPFAASAVSRYSDLTADQYDVDDQGNIVVSSKGDSGGVGTVTKAVVGAAAEVAVEKYLEVVGGKVLGAVGGKPLKGLSKSIEKSLVATPAGRALLNLARGYNKVGRITSINGLPSEVAEEYVQSIFDDIIGLGSKSEDGSGFINGGVNGISKAWGEATRDGGMWTGAGLLDLTLSMIGSMAIQGVAGYAMQANNKEFKEYRQTQAKSFAEIRGWLQNIVGIDQKKIDALTPKQQKVVLEIYNNFNNNPERLEEASKRFGGAISSVLDDIRGRQSADFTASLEAQGMTPDEFVIPTERDASGNEIPRFQNMMFKDPVTGKMLSRYAAWDDEHNVGIVAVGNGKYRVLNGQRQLASEEINSLADALQRSNEVVVQNQALNAANAKKAAFLETIKRERKTGANVVAYGTMVDLLAAHPELKNDKDFNPANPSVRLANETAFVLDNIATPQRMEQLYNHESILHEGLAKLFPNIEDRVKFLQDHIGLERVLGEAIRQCSINDFDVLVKNNPELAVKDNDGAIDATATSQKIRKWLADDYNKNGGNGTSYLTNYLKDARNIEEAFVWALEKLWAAPNEKKGALRTFVGTLRSLFSTTPSASTVAKMTDKEIVDELINSLHQAAIGEGESADNDVIVAPRGGAAEVSIAPEPTESNSERKPVQTYNAKPLADESMTDDTETDEDAFVEKHGIEKSEDGAPETKTIETKSHKSHKIDKSRKINEMSAAEKNRAVSFEAYDEETGNGFFLTARTPIFVLPVGWHEYMKMYRSVRRTGYSRRPSARIVNGGLGIHDPAFEDLLDVWENMRDEKGTGFYTNLWHILLGDRKKEGYNDSYITGNLSGIIPDSILHGLEDDDLRAEDIINMVKSQYEQYLKWREKRLNGIGGEEEYYRETWENELIGENLAETQQGYEEAFQRAAKYLETFEDFSPEVQMFLPQVLETLDFGDWIRFGKDGDNWLVIDYNKNTGELTLAKDEDSTRIFRVSADGIKEITENGNGANDTVGATAAEEVEQHQQQGPGEPNSHVVSNEASAGNSEGKEAGGERKDGNQGRTNGAEQVSESASGVGKLVPMPGSDIKVPEFLKRLYLAGLASAKESYSDVLASIPTDRLDHALAAAKKALEDIKRSEDWEVQAKTSIEGSIRAISKEMDLRKHLTSPEDFKEWARSHGGYSSLDIIASSWNIHTGENLTAKDFESETGIVMDDDEEGVSNNNETQKKQLAPSIKAKSAASQKQIKAVAERKAKANEAKKTDAELAKQVEAAKSKHRRGDMVVARDEDGKVYTGNILSVNDDGTISIRARKINGEVIRGKNAQATTQDVKLPLNSVGGDIRMGKTQVSSSELAKAEALEETRNAKLDNRVVKSDLDGPIAILADSGVDFMRVGAMVYAMGNTFKNKEAIKNIGFRWVSVDAGNGEHKVWGIDAAKIPSSTILDEIVKQGDTDTLSKAFEASDKAKTKWKENKKAKRAEDAKAKEEAKFSAPERNASDDDLRNEADSISWSTARLVSNEGDTLLGKQLAFGRKVSDAFFNRGIGTRFAQFVKFADEMLGSNAPKARKFYPSWYIDATIDIRSDIEGVDDSATVGKEYAKLVGKEASEEKDGIGHRVPVVSQEWLIPDVAQKVSKTDYGSAAFRLDDEQLRGVNLALNAVEAADGHFMLADGTGFGKTAQLLTIADAYKKAHPGANVLVLTKNKTIIADSFTHDSSALGIDLNKFDLGTYADLASGKFDGKAYDLGVFDEAHLLKNLASARGTKFQQLDIAHKVLATATPMDKFVDAAYFLASINNTDADTVAHRLGYSLRWVDGKNGPYQVAEMNDDTDFRTARRSLMIERDKAIASGRMIRRALPFLGTIDEAYEIGRMSVAHAKNEREIMDYYDSQKSNLRFVRKIYLKNTGKSYERAKLEPETWNIVVQKKLLELGNDKINAIDTLNESEKAKAAHDLAVGVLKKDHNARVIIACSQVNEHKIDGGWASSEDRMLLSGLAHETRNGRIVYTVPASIQRLNELFVKDGLGDSVAKIYGSHNKEKEQADFVGGKKNILVMTAKSGGTGVNLDDTTGEHPTHLILLAKDYSAKELDQLFGRVSRKNTKSLASIYALVFTDSQSDKHRDNVVNKKMSILKAIQGGNDTDIAGGANEREALSGEGADGNDEEKSARWSKADLDNEAKFVASIANKDYIALASSENKPKYLKDISGKDIENAIAYGGNFTGKIFLLNRRLLKRYGREFGEDIQAQARSAEVLARASGVRVVENREGIKRVLADELGEDFRRIGSGTFATVYGNATSDYVYKVRRIDTSGRRGFIPDLEDIFYANAKFGSAHNDDVIAFFNNAKDAENLILVTKQPVVETLMDRPQLIKPAQRALAKIVGGKAGADGTIVADTFRVSDIGHGGNLALDKNKKYFALDPMFELRNPYLGEESDTRWSSEVLSDEEIQAQYDDVVRRYRGTDKWLKAPNGKPSLIYVGTGEGGQVYGWGLYGSTVHGVAEYYASLSSDGRAIPPTVKKNGKVIGDGATDAELFAKAMIANVGGVKAALWRMKDYVDDHPDAEEWKSAIKDIEGGGYSYSRGGDIYSQTFFTNRAPGDESHLLSWYDEAPRKMIDDSVAILRENGFDVRRQKNNDGWQVFKPGEDKPYFGFKDYGKSKFGNVTVQAVYQNLASVLSPQKASEGLAVHDWDGIKYPVDSYGKTVNDGDKVGWNYVSFRGDNIRVDHKWVDGEQRWSSAAVSGVTNEEARQRVITAKQTPRAKTVRGDDEVLKGARRLASNKDAMEAEVAALNRRARAINAEENVALSQRELRTYAAYNVAVDALNKFIKDHNINDTSLKGLPAGDKEEYKALKQETTKLGLEVDRIVNARTAAMGEVGRALRTNRFLFTDDLTYAGLRGRITAAAGRQLTDEELAEIRNIVERAQVLDRKEREIWLDNLVNAATNALAKIKAEAMTERINAPSVANERLKAAAAYENAKKQIQSAAVGVSGSAATARADGEGAPKSANIFAGLKPALKALAKYYVLQNNNIKIDELTQKLLDEVQPYFPDVTANDIHRILSGYGTSWETDRTDAERKLSDLTSQARILEQIADIQNGLAPLRTGAQRTPPTDEQRALMRQERELLREAEEKGIIKPTKDNLKTALQTAKTRLRNRIADLNKAIAEHNMIKPHQASNATDAELEDLRRQKEEAEALYKEAFATELKEAEQAAKLRNIEAALDRSLAKLEEQLARAKAGDFSKEAKIPLPENGTIKALRSRIEATRAEIKALHDAKYPDGTPEEQSVKVAKAFDSINDSIATWRERIAKGDVAPRKRKDIPFKSEAERRQYEQLQQDRKELYRVVVDMREHIVNKDAMFGLGYAKEYAKFTFNLLRAMQATFDLSAVMRQTSTLTKSHPVLAALAMKKSLFAALSDMDAAKVDEELRAIPEITEAIRNGWLVWKDLGGNTEEHYRNLGTQAITIGHNADGTEKRVTINDIPVFKQLSKYILKPSERQYVTYINAISAATYLALIQDPKWGASGANEFTKREIASYINMANGSAQLGAKGKQAVGFLSSIFWAPKLAFSRAQLATFSDVIHPFTGNKNDASMGDRRSVAATILRERIKSLVVALAAGFLLSCILGDDDDKDRLKRQAQEREYLDLLIGIVRPRVGATTVDFTGGVAAYYRLMQSLFTGVKHTDAGNKIPLDSYGRSVIGELSRFVQGKVAPHIGTILNFFEGKDFVGDKFGLEQLPAQFIPLSARDVFDGIRYNGLLKGMLLAPFTVLGAGGNSYPNDRHKESITRLRNEENEYKKLMSDRKFSEARDYMKSHPLLKKQQVIDSLEGNVRATERSIKKYTDAGKEPPEGLTKLLERQKEQVMKVVRSTY